jgi:hypothetical protein
MMSSVGLPLKTSIEPFVPAGTIVAFAIVLPEGELSVDTPENGSPVGQTVMKSSRPIGTAVIFKE